MFSGHSTEHNFSYPAHLALRSSPGIPVLLSCLCIYFFLLNHLMGIYANWNGYLCQPVNFYRNVKPTCVAAMWGCDLVVMLLKHCFHFLVTEATQARNWKTMYSVRYFRQYWRKHREPTNRILYMSCQVTHLMTWRKTWIGLQHGLRNGRLEHWVGDWHSFRCCGLHFTHKVFINGCNKFRLYVSHFHFQG